MTSEWANYIAFATHISMHLIPIAIKSSFGENMLDYQTVFEKRIPHSLLGEERRPKVG